MSQILVFLEKLASLKIDIEPENQEEEEEEEEEEEKEEEEEQEEEEEKEVYQGLVAQTPDEVPVMGTVDWGQQSLSHRKLHTAHYALHTAHYTLLNKDSATNRDLSN